MSQLSELRSYASWHHLAHKILGREVFLGAIFPTPTSENIGTLGNEFSFSSVFFWDGHTHFELAIYVVLLY